MFFSVVYGSHTGQAYSSDGRIRDAYACSLAVVELFFFLIFLRRNPRVLFAFVVIQVIIKLLNGQPYTTSVAGSEVATVYSNQIDPGLMRLVLLDL